MLVQINRRKLFVQPRQAVTFRRAGSGIPYASKSDPCNRPSGGKPTIPESISSERERKTGKSMKQRPIATDCIVDASEGKKAHCRDGAFERAQAGSKRNLLLILFLPAGFWYLAYQGPSNLLRWV
jgi:hypothetical protein